MNCEGVSHLSVLEMLDRPCRAGLACAENLGSRIGINHCIDMLTAYMQLSTTIPTQVRV